VDKNSTVGFLAPLMSTIADAGASLSRETKAAQAMAEVQERDDVFARLVDQPHISQN
jgi:hypothetical protein